MGIVAHELSGCVGVYEQIGYHPNQYEVDLAHGQEYTKHAHDIAVDTPCLRNQQADRFLAFEMLYHVVHASYNEVVPSALADKLGLNYKLVSTMIRQIGRRETTSQLKQRFNEQL